MPFLVTPNIIAIFTLGVLAALGIIALARYLTDRYSRGKRPVILKLRGAKNISDILRTVGTPLVFETAVNQLGDKRSFYVAVSSSKAARVSGSLDAEEVDDYELYYPNGVHVGGYLRGSGKLSDLSIEKIDFGNVNEIGEGAVVQFLFHKKRGRKIEANVRILVSAPSSYQAKEILSNIKNSVSALKMVEVKNREFIENVDSRRFEPKEALQLTL